MNGSERNRLMDLIQRTADAAIEAAGGVPPSKMDLAALAATEAKMKAHEAAKAQMETAAKQDQAFAALAAAESKAAAQAAAQAQIQSMETADSGLASLASAQAKASALEAAKTEFKAESKASSDPAPAPSAEPPAATQPKGGWKKKKKK
jgi:hypothetical protein